MLGSVRRLLFASLIACHAIATLCGPCLHELSGLSHPIGAAGKPDRTDAPAQSPSDSADNCPICHFVAQGQLIITPVCERSEPILVNWLTPEAPAARPAAQVHASAPRAPPALCSSVA